MSRALAIVGLVLASACLSPRQPADPRYFSPGGAIPPAADDARARPDGPELRLRRVFAADYLRKRMVWRKGVEVGFHELLRWTEPPSRYVQARLEHELFERRGLRQVTRPNARALTVELTAFDDVLEPTHEAVVSLDVLLVDASQVALLDRVFTVSRPIEGDEPEAVARALGEALTQGIGEIGEAVERALAGGLPSPAR